MGRSNNKTDTSDKKNHEAEKSLPYREAVSGRDPIVIRVQTREQQELFLTLPHKLYAEGQSSDKGSAYHQDDRVVEQFLNGSHPLSDDAEISHYLLMNKGQALGRMTLTFVPGSQTLYLGFFECLNDQNSAELLFEAARIEARRRGLSTITGPVDVSFWIGYRFKLNNFDRVYFGEPQNKEYYPALFEGGGFVSVNTYVSHYHRPLTGDEADLAKFRRRSELAKKRGLCLVHPDYADFDRYLEDIHELLMELYRDFPAFHPISFEDFKAIFSGLKLITDPNLIVLAYDGKVPAGFFISFPDYGNELLQGSRLRRLWKLWRLKRHPKQIVLSYSGVRHGYEGLSGALYYNILLKVKAMGLPAVSTLMKKGKVTAGFGREAEESTTEYRLYEMKTGLD